MCGFVSQETKKSHISTCISFCSSFFWSQFLFHCTRETQSLVPDEPEKHSQELSEQKLHVNCNH